MLCLLVWTAQAQLKVKLFNVKDYYGAIADGKTDNRVVIVN